jgi:hypothetical protein
MIRVFLNNTLCSDDFIGLDSLSEELKLSEDLHGYLYQITGSLTFIGDNYDTIRALYDSNYCQDVDIEIQLSQDFGNTWYTITKGIVKLTGVKWDLVSRQVECPITDNSFLSGINNNKSIKFLLGNPKFNGDPVLSKNGVDVTYKEVFHDNVQLFSPLRSRYFEDEAYFLLEGAYKDLRPSGRKGMFIYDALNLIVAMMTDDGVDVVSDFFSYDLVTPLDYNEEAFGVLFCGNQMRQGTGVPYISFEDLFEDLHRIFNVYFALEVSATGKPVLRVESESYFRQANSNVYFDSVQTLDESISLSKIYSKIELGCSKEDKTFPIEDVPLILHGQEEYGLTGVCNVDNTLELRLQTLIINTNSIALALPPLSGFNSGGSIIKRYSTEVTTAGTGGQNQILNDSNAEFEVHGIGDKYLIKNTVTGEWSYITLVGGNATLAIWDILLEVDNPSTGIPKNYQIFEPNNFESYDEDIFLIQVDRTTATSTDLYAFSTTITLPDVWYYNALYANYKVIERHLGGLSQDIINQISDGNDEFNAGVIASFVGEAQLTVLNDSMYRAIPFDDDSTGPTYFDTNGNYNNTNGFYIVPQNGYYHAQCEVNVRNETSVDGGISLVFQVELSHLSASGDILETIADFSTITYLGNATFTLDKLFSCDEGDVICVVVKQPYNTGISGTYPLSFIPWNVSGVLIRQPTYPSAPPVTSTFGVDALFNGGGVLTPSDPAEVRLLEVNAELSVERDVFDTLLQNPYKYYHVNYGITNYMTGFISNITRGILNGKTSLSLFKKKNGV